jgi:predicted O-methyltransferase YrrM
MNRTILPGVERNRQVKGYICNHFCEESIATAHALQRSEKEGLKPIQVPLNVAKMLAMIAKLKKPKRILEIGTLGGYSALWLVQGLAEGGKLITIECDPKHIAVAKENFAFANVGEFIEIRSGYARDILEEMIAQNEGPFDLIFLDGDKSEYPEYLEPFLELSTSGTILLTDNAIPKRGEIGCPDPRDAEAVAVYLFNQMVADHPVLETIPLTTIVGENGRIDAISLTIVR